MHMHFRALIALTLVAAPVAAQISSPHWQCAGGAVTTTLPGSLTDENTRAQTIRSGGAWSLLRASTDAAVARISADSSGTTLRFAAVLPELLVTTQQSFALPANDGPLWAGRGLSYSVTGGVAVCGKGGRWGAVVAPTYWYAENSDLDLPTSPRIVPPQKSGYSAFASPYFYAPRSLDSPRRFGAAAIRRVDPGAITVFVRAARAEIGFSTAPQWWGPGQQNALLLSSQAAGVPRAYARTVRPIRVAGELDALFFLGGLSYSPFYRDPQPPDSARALAGLALVWRPAFEKGLSLGAARIVAAPILGNGWIRHLFDPVLSTGSPNARDRRDSTAISARDQLFSLFGDWRLPDDGTEIWFEWGRAEWPTSLSDFVASPNHTQALTLGLQHVEPMYRKDWTWRIGAEYSQTNQSSTYRERFTGSWYTSRAVSGGFSQKGQVLGAAIGPGSVTQRLNLDVNGPRHSIGVFAYRIKWDDDSYYTIPRPDGGGICKHDVSLALGVRGSARTRAGWLDAQLTSQNRLDIYWQALGYCWDNPELEIDKSNLTLEFRFHPRIH